MSDGAVAIQVAPPTAEPTRAQESKKPWVPDYPKAYIAFPAILLLIAIGLMACGLESRVHPVPIDPERILATFLAYLVGRKLSLLVVLGCLTIVFQSYHLVAEQEKWAYCYYAILIPDSILFALYTLAFSSWVMVVKIFNEPPTAVASMVLSGCGMVLLLAKVILLGIAVAKHRKRGGGHSKWSPAVIARAIELDANSDDVENDAAGADDRGGDPITPGNVGMAVMDGNRDNSEKIDTFRSNRSSIHYDYGQPYQPSQRLSVNGSPERNSSVHRVAGQANHPLRMNPAALTHPVLDCCIHCRQRAEAANARVIIAEGMAAKNAVEGEREQGPSST